MKKEILKRLLATPGAEHTVSEFDTHFTGDLTKQGKSCDNQQRPD